MLSMRRLLCFHHDVTTFLSKRHARVLKGGRKIPVNANFGPQDSFRDNEPDDDDVPEMSELHAIEDQINVVNPRDPEFQTAAQRYEKKQREWLKNKIIEKKYFSPPKETSLLTWNAKEQIRYLNREYPDQWTPEKLSKSFPISPDGVIRLVKSKFFFKTEEEIEKHDQRIHKRWLELRSQLKKGVEFVDSEYKRLLEEGQLSCIMNAGGMPSLPMPPKPNLSKLPVSKPKQVGAFEAIIRGYIDSKKPKQIESKESKMIVPKIDDEKVLQEISDCFSGSQWSSHGFLKAKDNDAVSEAADCVGIHSSSIDEILKSDDNSKVKMHRLSRRLRRMAKEQRDGLNVDSENFNTLQMLETKKVSHTAGTRNSVVGDEIDPGDRINSLADASDSKYMQEDPFSVAHLRERREARNKDTKYTFGENFKKEDISLEDETIKVTKKMQQKGSFFRKGNAVYDENGELLYKIP
ncbi:hypothetical protein CHS0354_036730 [Potamilus streckersoni]|uniref:Neurite outgrowth-associated protein n=1 Tax=Potamilus streckersoni TaxID=2493646 RepID=A0AAE0WBB6_9BIVA|nr:hypothetical protein CHS0354_036730 [Potamilus streckersoni]